MIALLPHCGFLSETTRMLAIGQALVARGQPVVFATHGGPYAHVIEDAGFPLTRLGPPMDDARCAQFLRDLVQLGRPGLRLQPADEVRASVQAEAAFLRAHGARMAVIGFTLTAYLSSRLAGIPLGVWLLPRLDPALFKFGLGLLLVTACPALLRSASRPPRVMSPLGARWGDALAGMAGGTMGGLGGLTGVAPALWTSLRGLPKDDQRTQLQNFNLAALTVTMVAYAASGTVGRPQWPWLAAVALVVVPASLVGARVYRGLSGTAFRRTVLWLLTASGAAMLVSAAPRLAAG